MKPGQLRLFMSYRTANNIQTMEVATARVYNWDVTMKRKEKREQETAGEKEETGTPNG
jgi:hypothetical protein